MREKIFDLEKGRMLTDKETKRLIEIRAKMFNDECVREGCKNCQIKDFWKKKDLLFSGFEEYYEINGHLFDSHGSWVKIDTEVFNFPFGFEREIKAISKLLNKKELRNIK